MFTSLLVRKIIFNSLKKSKPGWKLTPFNDKYKQIADIMINTKKYNIIIKFKATNKEIIKYSSINKNSLSLMSQYYIKHKNNLVFLFLYYAGENKLIVIDIESFLNMKASQITIEKAKEYGYVIGNWKKLDKYFDIIANFKEETHTNIIKGRCVHCWLIESMEESRTRSSISKYSMGRCKYCGKLRFDFANFVEEMVINGVNIGAE